MNTTPLTTLKRTAKQAGLTTGDLLVMGRQNDPFGMGQKAQIAAAEWFVEVLARLGSPETVYIRRVHYACASWGDMLRPCGRLYGNTQKDAAYMVNAGKAARYLGYIPFDAVIDQKNAPCVVGAHYGTGPNAQYDIEVPELDSASVSVGPWVPGAGHGYNPSSVQPYHLEVWCEKSAVNDVLIPLCRRHGANFVYGEGELSLTQSWKLHRRLVEAGKPARLFYVSDFDPGGQSMPRAVSRRAEWFREFRRAEYDIKLCPLVLTAEQVREYDLPPVPMKTDKSKAYRTRAANFMQQHDVRGGTELDALEALHPGMLERIVGDALSAYWSEDADEELQRCEQDLREAAEEKVGEVMGDYQELLDGLAPMVDELESIDLGDMSQYEPAVAQEEDVEGDAAGFRWLFDSDRTFGEQLAAYQE